MDPIVQALQGITNALQHWFPTWLMDTTQVALVLLTGITLFYLRKYTAETVEMRKATRDQVHVNNLLLAETREQIRLNGELLRAAQEQASASTLLLKETQAQNEQSLMPVLVLTIAGSGENSMFVLKNTGTGPALNAMTKPMLSPGELSTWRLEHGAVIAAGDQDAAFLYLDYADGHIRPNQLLRFIRSSKPERKFIAETICKGVSGRSYLCVHTLGLTADTAGLIVKFDDFREVAFEREANA